MARVTVEGSRNLPNTFLRPGRRMTGVERTPLLDKMIRKGFVTVIPDTAVDVVKHVTETVDAARAAADAERQLSGAPARNASREDWAEFLRRKGFLVDETWPRAHLIELWDTRNDHAPAEVEAEEESEDDGGTAD